ncbi:hypothetical protein FQR65_LT14356 [Abscondita terminalis]|nr:hypothetical protein FQR65_LT14356 [Abscondita terminalis]
MQNYLEYRYRHLMVLVPENIKLADGNFNKSQPVDILIGASNFYNLMSIGQIDLGTDKPILQKIVRTLSENATDKHAIKKLQIHTESVKFLSGKYDEILLKLELAGIENKELIESNEFYNKSVDLVARAEILSEFNSNQSQTTSLNISSSDNFNGANAKLPRISLPSFDGSCSRKY